MITFPKMSFLSEIQNRAPIPPGKRAYFQTRLKNRLYNFVVTKFLEEERAGNLTRAELARRIGRKPEVITRILKSPGNWRLDTVSDLLLGIAGEELDTSSSSLLNRPTRNFALPDWAVQQPDDGNKLDPKSKLIPKLNDDDDGGVLSVRSRP
jgi:hypothetical protein